MNSYFMPDRSRGDGAARWIGLKVYESTTLAYGGTVLGHALRVADRVNQAGGDSDMYVAAVLHDAVEDTEWTLEDLASIEEVYGHRFSVSPRSLELIDLLTHPPELSYGEYIRRMTYTPEAAFIKTCDIHDNLDPVRMVNLPGDKRKQLTQKYAKALAELSVAASQWSPE